MNVLPGFIIFCTEIHMAVSEPSLFCLCPLNTFPFGRVIYFFILYVHVIFTVELRWLEHLWDYENLFEAGVVRATEGL